MYKKRGKISPFFLDILDFARQDIKPIAAFKAALCVIVATAVAIRVAHILMHKCGDMLAGGLAIGAGAGKPTVIGENANKGDITEQVDIAGGVDFDMGLRIRHSGKFFNGHLGNLLYRL